ncbi:IMP dehydrogenase [Peredibacter starrii]|uniref:Inosine-5'-monophosphate dehydrogenase n=1 Tax=Peredibacter starrii TaxID=28202 RepID=A0AAX4HN48_9BACT|nr:IMP dehydrogenase [Peredibacter starrii]WPU64592.1 IMP dehydrogenase [Peredibacter starrii]
MFYTEDSALTYDDVLIVPNYSEVLPTEVELKTKFSKNITMNIPIVSSAMDTVTESRTAIVMAQEGGIGVIHKNMTPEEQAFEVEKVKKYESGMILDPFTVTPDQKISDLFDLMKKYKISGFPVVEKDKTLVGMITNRDLRFVSDTSKKVKDIMTSKNLVTAPEGTSFEKAKGILQNHRVEKLPVVNAEGKLRGLITIKDIEKTIAFPNANKDQFGRLRVAAACGVGEKELKRVETLIKAHVDAIVVDTAHGHSKGVIEMVKAIKKMNASVDVVAGNVATAKACEDLIAAGVDGIKVGIGPGSICTTRIIAGIGVPQMQAIFDCKPVCEKAGIPFIADGGIKYSGDIFKALAGGASTVMIGSLFAGTDEAPGEMVLYQGRAYKMYRGMGSLGAMEKGSKDRYGQSAVEEMSKLVPEGIEGQVPYRGSLSTNLFHLVGGVRSGMGYVGAPNMTELHKKAKFIKITAASLKESHPHDVIITKEAPNYRQV